MSKQTQQKAVASLTYVVVQGYSAVTGVKGKISADPLIQARDQDHAMRIVARLKETKAGVVAFCRTGCPDTGDWDDAVIIARYGLTPGEIDELEDVSESGFKAA